MCGTRRRERKRVGGNKIFLAYPSFLLRPSIHNMHTLLLSRPCWVGFCCPIRGPRINFSRSRDATDELPSERRKHSIFTLVVLKYKTKRIRIEERGKRAGIPEPGLYCSIETRWINLSLSRATKLLLIRRHNSSITPVHSSSSNLPR